jgi:uncharacterized cupin superfamily protein
LNYKNRIFPLVKELRGSYRLLTYLRKFAARDIDQVQEGEGIDQFSWDNLIILDACRHDLYEEVNGPTESRVSCASHTQGFIAENFSKEDRFQDTIYITANPQLDDSILEEVLGTSDLFHEKYEVYRTDWSDEKNTVLPDPVVRDAKSAEKLFPEKRKIIHFMQPHYPFIDSDLVYEGQANLEQIEGEGTLSVWDAAEKGEVERKEVWQEYRKNLEFIMPFVEELVDSLEGKTIITSDHGNLVGENGLYGHPGELNLEPLRKVPLDIRE